MTSQGYLHTSQQHLSADQPPQASVLSTWVLKAVNHHSCSNDSTKTVRTQSLVLFFFPSPLKTMSFKLYFYSSPWWLHNTQQGGDEKRCRSWIHPAAKHRSTDYDTLLRRSLGHLPKGLTFQCHSCESLNILSETLTSFWDTSIWKIGPSFPHVELGKGNRMDMLDVQGKYIMLVSTSGRF